MSRLEASQRRLPPLYVENTFKPFMEIMEGLGTRTIRSSTRSGDDFFLMQISPRHPPERRVLRGDRDDGFQEVISDLYDGFLSEEDRWG